MGKNLNLAKKYKAAWEQISYCQVNENNEKHVSSDIGVNQITGKDTHTDNTQSYMNSVLCLEPVSLLYVDFQELNTIHHSTVHHTPVNTE